MDYNELFRRAFDRAAPQTDDDSFVKSVIERTETMKDDKEKGIIKTERKKLIEITVPEYEKPKHRKAPLIAGIAALTAAAAGIGFFAGNYHGSKPVEVSPLSGGAAFSANADEEMSEDAIYTKIEAAREKRGEIMVELTKLQTMNDPEDAEKIAALEAQAAYYEDLIAEYSRMLSTADPDDTGINFDPDQPAIYHFPDFDLRVRYFDYDGITLTAHYDLIYPEAVSGDSEEMQEPRVWLIGKDPGGTAFTREGIFRSTDGDDPRVVSYTDTVRFSSPSDIAQFRFIDRKDNGDPDYIPYTVTISMNLSTSDAVSAVTTAIVLTKPDLSEVSYDISEYMYDFDPDTDCIAEYDYDKCKVYVTGYEYDGTNLRLCYLTVYPDDTDKDVLTAAFPVMCDEDRQGGSVEDTSNAGCILNSIFLLTEKTPHDTFDVYILTGDDDWEDRENYRFTGVRNCEDANYTQATTVTAEVPDTAESEISSEFEGADTTVDAEILGFADKNVTWLGTKYDGRIVKVYLECHDDGFMPALRKADADGTTSGYRQGYDKQDDGTYVVWANILLPEGEHQELEIIDLDAVVKNGSFEAGGSFTLDGTSDSSKYERCGVDMANFGIPGVKLSEMFLSKYGLELYFTSDSPMTGALSGIQISVTSLNGTEVPAHGYQSEEVYDEVGKSYITKLLYVPRYETDLTAMREINVNGFRTKVAEFSAHEFVSDTSPAVTSVIAEETAVVQQEP